MNRKHLWWLAAGISCMGLIVLFIVLNSNTERAKTTWRIGAILPQTGNLAYLGEPEAAALRFAVKEINAAEGRNAVQLLIEDGKGDPKDAVNAAKKLIDLHQIDVGLVSSSASANAVAPVFQASGTPLITVCSDDSIPEKYDRVVNVYINLATEQQVMAEYLLDQKIATVSALRVNAQISKRAVDLLLKDASGRIGLVGDVTYELTASEFRNVVTRIKEDGAQAIYIMGYGVEFPGLVKTLREQEVNKRVFGNYAFLSDSATKDGTKLFRGIDFTAFTVTPAEILKTPFGQGFEKELGRRPGPFLDYAFVYESIKIWHNLVKTGTPPKQFATAVRGKAFESLLGPLRIDASGNADIPMAIATYADDGAVTIKWKKN